MSDFSAFMFGNALQDDIVNFVVSRRFVQDGKPIEWQLKAIDSDLDERLRKECTVRTPIVGKKGQYTQDIDTDKYIAKMCVACIVYPNLNDVELQSSYNVMSGEDLLKKMLKSGEYTELKAKVMEINGYNLTMDELIDEAKN